MILRSVSSSRAVFAAKTGETPSFIPRRKHNSVVSLCPFGPSAATIAFVQIRRRPDSIPPHAYFVGSAVFHYLGPSFAVLLFARVEPLGVAWLRIATAAAVFAIWRRPWRRLAGLDRSGWLLIGGLGAVFAAMNACFYVAIDRLPLAMVAAVEFLGPVGLALLGARIARNLAAVAAAAVGVYLLTQVRLVGEPVGVA